MNCWICGRPGATLRRTLLLVKKPVCPDLGCRHPKNHNKA